MRKASWPTDDDLLHFDPFSGDRDVIIECRKVKIVSIRKERRCMAGLLIDLDHVCSPGTKMVRETAKVDGQFGSSYQCLDCLRSLYRINYADA
jgi:hypothetical protein